MFVNQTRITLLVFTATLAAGQFLGQTTTLAQMPAGTPDAFEQDLVAQVHQLQEELRYLRTRDAERDAWESKIAQRLPETDQTVTPISYSMVGPTGATACQSSPCGPTCQQCGTGCQESCCPSCGGCSGRSCGGCYSCLCHPEPAPCVKCPRVTTLNPYFNVHIFGGMTMDMVFSEARAVAPGTPYYLLPGSPAGLSQYTSDIHARQSSIGAAFTGPQIGSFQTGGMLLGFFYNDNAFADAYGFLPAQAWGDLKNENWRLAAGYQFDVFNPGVPTILPFSILLGSGNSGNAFRGQVRLERFLHPRDDAQWTVQFALSEPITSVIDPEFRLSEDNGWPNVEGRIALGLGGLEGMGAAAKRPFEIGVSGVVGQVRNTVLDDEDGLTLDRFVSDVWGLGVDFRWKMNEFFGVMGEFYTGEGLGTYNGGVLQIFNPDDNFQAIRSTGGWLEAFVYWTPCLHSHVGFGIDDPQDGDVSGSDPVNNVVRFGRVENSTIYGNLLWDLTKSFRVAFEVSWRETDYKNPIVPDNEGAFFHTQFAWSF